MCCDISYNKNQKTVEFLSSEMSRSIMLFAIATFLKSSLNTVNVEVFQLQW